MIAIQLDSRQELRLAQLATAQGQDSETLARQVLLDYLEFQDLPADSEEAWAQASVELTQEFMASERWDDNSHGPQ